MIYLLLSILCSAMISIVMRLSEGKVKSTLCMLAANYVVCFFLSWGFDGFGNPFPNIDGMLVTSGMGSFNGLFYMLALVLGQYSISKNGVILSSVFSKTGALVIPLLMSVIIFAEVPTLFQFLGFVLAVISVVTINYRKGENAGKFQWSLLALLVAEGFAGVMAKVFNEVGNSELNFQFLLITFLTAFLFCAIVIVCKKERVGRKEVLYGVMIGVPNFFASQFVLMALKTVPAVVVYPAKGVATIGVITIAGLLVFKEKLSKKQIIVMGIIAIALILLSV